MAEDSVLDLWDFIFAVFTDWVALMSGVVSVILTLLGFAYNWQTLPGRSFRAFALVSFLIASARVWTIEHRKNQNYVRSADAPYVLLSYLRAQNSPSGFYIFNHGRETAIQVHINDISLGSRIATFGEFPSLQPDGQDRGTYPATVLMAEGETPSIVNDLNSLFIGLSKDAEVAVSVDYWALDNIRKFRTNGVLHYYHEGSHAEVRSQKRELISTN
jgi:hypothetical protein